MLAVGCALNQITLLDISIASAISISMKHEIVQNNNVNYIIDFHLLHLIVTVASTSGSIYSYFLLQRQQNKL
jgi:hypothetical protein